MWDRDKRAAVRLGKGEGSGVGWDGDGGGHVGRQAGVCSANGLRAGGRAGRMAEHGKGWWVGSRVWLPERQVGRLGGDCEAQCCSSMGARALSGRWGWGWRLQRRRRNMGVWTSGQGVWRTEGLGRAGQGTAVYGSHPGAVRYFYVAWVVERGTGLSRRRQQRWVSRGPRGLMIGGRRGARMQRARWRMVQE